MAFLDILLDPAFSDGLQGGPEWGPDAVVPLESGDESREVPKTYGLGEWTLSYPAKKKAMYQRFQDHFLIVGGRRDSWRLWDLLDDECTAAQAHVEAIDATHWQMCKRRTIGSYTYDQPIILPVDYSVSGSGSTYTVSTTSGIITRTAGSATPTFSCRRFHKLCRFDFTHLVQTIEVVKPDPNDPNKKKLIVTYAGLTIKEIPLTSA